jgi:hypothetical protein
MRIVSVTRLATIATVTFVIVGASTCTGQSGSPGTSNPSGGAAGSSSPSSAAATNASIGQAIHVADSSGLSADVTVEKVTYATTGQGAIAQPPANGVYAVADVLIKVAGGDYSFNPLYFKYQTSDGTTSDSFSGNGLTAGFDPTLSSGTLHAGQQTRGNVVFDVKSKGGVMQVTDPLGSVVGQWTLPSN